MTGEPTHRRVRQPLNIYKENVGLNLQFLYYYVAGGISLTTELGRKAFLPRKLQRGFTKVPKNRNLERLLSRFPWCQSMKHLHRQLF